MGVLAQVKRHSQAAEEAVVDAAARMASALGQRALRIGLRCCRRLCLRRSRKLRLPRRSTSRCGTSKRRNRNRGWSTRSAARNAQRSFTRTSIEERRIGRPRDSRAASPTRLLAGFDALKIAPFDEVTTEACASGRAVRRCAPALRELSAAREAAGPARRLIVDCDWRFDEATAAQLIEAVAEYALHWIECPLPETTANVPRLSACAIAQRRTAFASPAWSRASDSRASARSARPVAATS